MPTLRVTVIEAKNLPNKEGLFGKSDPYTRLSIGPHGHMARTKTVKNNLNPCWNETFQFNFNNPSDMLNIQVYDEESIGSDELMCAANFPLNNLVQGKPEDIWLGLLDSKKKHQNAQIHLTLTALDFGKPAVQPMYPQAAAQPSYNPMMQNIPMQQPMMQPQPAVGGYGYAPQQPMAPQGYIPQQAQYAPQPQYQQPMQQPMMQQQPQYGQPMLQQLPQPGHGYPPQPQQMGQPAMQHQVYGIPPAYIAQQPAGGMVCHKCGGTGMKPPKKDKGPKPCKKCHGTGRAH